MVGQCLKCSGKRQKVTRHHIFGKKGLCGLEHNSTLPLMVFLSWLGKPWDDIDVMFWNNKIVPLCSECHKKFHIFFTGLINKCDDIGSEEPLKAFLEEIL